MKRRYQVFVSSTYTDLAPERREVIQALLELECFPAGMEMFPATNDDQWTLIKRVIEDSDYYVVIVANRYGSTDETGISYTEQEYDYARAAGKPILGFLHEDPTKIEAGKSDLDPDSAARLKAFRDKIRGKHIRHYTTPDQLAGRVSRSLFIEMRDNPQQGWIRGRPAEVLAEAEAPVQPDASPPSPVRQNPPISWTLRLQAILH